MAKPIKIWTGTEWVEVAVSIPNLDSYATSSSVTSAISAHESDTTNVHGIADTANLLDKPDDDQIILAAQVFG